jgi:hypothetical protein
MSSETRPAPELFEASVLFVEARYRERTLSARVLSTRSRGYTIGRGRRADAPVDPRYLPDDLAANDNHTLVEPTADGFVINLPPAMRARAERSPTRLRIPCGEVVFDVTATAPPPPVPRSWLRAGWRDDARITGAVALGLLLLVALVNAVPSDPQALSLDDVGRSLRFDTVRVVPPALVEVAPPKGAHRPAAGGVAPARSSGPTGAAGDPQARRADARRATKGPADRQDARAIEAYIRSNTLLAVFDGARSQAVTDVFAATPALGSDAFEVLAHLDGSVVASAEGAHGLGARGTGAGGADEGQAMIGGTHGLHTIGLRDGRGGPGLDDHGGGVLGTRQARAPSVVISPVIVRGGLDKELVRRVVRQHVNEVRACYEQALPRKPTLAGRVVAMFTIAPNGTVLTAALQASTLGERGVEDCIVAATRRWLYPQPLGGGTVTVSYPFLLTPAGG